MAPDVACEIGVCWTRFDHAGGGFEKHRDGRRAGHLGGTDLGLQGVV